MLKNIFYSIRVKKPLNYSVCQYASGGKVTTDTIKKFRPALGDATPHVVTEKVAKPTSTVRQIINKQRQEEKEGKVRHRKLHWFDKWILVRLGKYKSIKDVPNEIVYKTVQIGQKEKDAVKAEIMDKGFKMTMTTDYALTLFCLTGVGIVIYVYRQSKNETKPSE